MHLFLFPIFFSQTEWNNIPLHVGLYIILQIQEIDSIGSQSLPMLGSKFIGLHIYDIRVKRPIYIGKNQNPKNLGFLLYRLHCQKNP